MDSRLAASCAAGLSLVPIAPIDGKPTKAPRASNWNKPRSANNPNGYSNNAADFIGCDGFNFGLYHGASNTLALDLDDMELARQVFEELTDQHLADWLKSPERLEIKSPKANRGKLLFKLPEGFKHANLRKFKHNGAVIFELRCGNCQDVILGRHPEGGDYQLIGNPAAIPNAPAVLLDMLQHWEAWKPCFDSALGIAEPPKISPCKPLKGENLTGYRNPIKEFNQAFVVADVLTRNGYKQVSPDRFIRPGSSSKAPGAVIMRDCKDGVERVYSHGGDVLNDGFAHDAFDCMRLLEYGGEW
ncbi:MAG: bifunctional DNA primase/polymerase [Methylovulum sp.]|uniref:bifunctional DNA primase/polymerase n=1 Tax=Methylovulum sp. TaxID=1916980 RepID=UPI002607AA39|nr:bifunctional DNA primase/polymerase [Methylovulum sp.]MDD2724518.1 bifunctional DNA primase/polymerase [Methylovulum sp.]MDD5124051.1 bifunctional DNA primase/polymerase [Methylovulum sp.]